MGVSHSSSPDAQDQPAAAPRRVDWDSGGFDWKDRRYKTSLLVLGSPGDAEDSKANAGKISKRRGGGGLPGVWKDVDNVAGVFRRRLGSEHLFVQECRTKFARSEALDLIKRLFNQEDAEKFARFDIYYSGHGYRGSGRWVFSDGGVGLRDVMKLWRKRRTAHISQRLWLWMDSCHSGAWLDEFEGLTPQESCVLIDDGGPCHGQPNYALQLYQFNIAVACDAASVTYDSSAGGEATLKWMLRDMWISIATPHYDEKPGKIVYR